MIYKKHLQLIQVVHNNMSHIEDLEILGKMFANMVESEYSKEYPSIYNLTQDQIDHLCIVCKTTQNSHYEYNLFTDATFQNPNNHVDAILLNTHSL